MRLKHLIAGLLLTAGMFLALCTTADVAGQLIALARGIINHLAALM